MGDDEMSNIPLPDKNGEERGYIGHDHVNSSRVATLLMNDQTAILGRGTQTPLTIRDLTHQVDILLHKR
jgi:hypothetical protein